MPTDQTTDPPTTVLPDGFDDETSEFYVHPELQPHYRAGPADRKAIEPEAVLVMVGQAAEAEVAKAVERESDRRYATERIFTRQVAPAGPGYFLSNASWRPAHESREPTDVQVQLT